MKERNILGTIAFIIALISLIIGWIPIVGWILGWILSVLGLLLSTIALFKKPKGLAITGLVISLLVMILLTTLLSY